MAQFEFYFLAETYESQIILIVFHYLAAMASRKSPFNRNGLVTDQSLTAMV